MRVKKGNCSQENWWVITKNNGNRQWNGTEVDIYTSKLDTYYSPIKAKSKVNKEVEILKDSQYKSKEDEDIVQNLILKSHLLCEKYGKETFLRYFSQVIWGKRGTS